MPVVGSGDVRLAVVYDMQVVEPYTMSRKRFSTDTTKSRPHAVHGRVDGSDPSRDFPGERAAPGIWNVFESTRTSR